MKLCRFNTDSLGVVDGDMLADVSAALDALPLHRWATPLHDPVIADLDSIRSRIEQLLPDAPRLNIKDVKLDSPVATPTKIIGAPVNYHAHLEEALGDKDLHQGRTVHPIDEIGCFLKANSALTGPEAIINRPFPEGRIDHEAEVAVVIGKTGHKVKAANAMELVAGYTLALDMTVRGKQDRSLRKSCDGFAVVGPWLVTADEIIEPNRIPFSLSVNGETRQQADTSLLIRSIPELIEMVSAFYTLHPGDIIMTGTPEGVSPVASGDRIVVNSPVLGTLAVTIGA